MARLLHKLGKAASVATIKKPGLHADGGNLYLQVTSSAAPEGKARPVTRSWIFRFGKRYHGLGPYPTISVAKAREEAARCRQLVAGGQDPIAVHRERQRAAAAAAAKTKTFEACAQAYIADHEKVWKGEKTALAWRSIFRDYVYPIMGTLPVGDVDTDLVMKVLKPLWFEKPATASNARAYIETVLDYARVSGYRSGENPARWRGHLVHRLPPSSKVRRVQHHRALPYAEAPAFMARLRKQQSIPARATEFLILTATRMNETLGALWKEIDLEKGIWTVPALRSKRRSRPNAKDHVVPLSRRAVAILKEMAETQLNEFVFPGMKMGRPLSKQPIETLVKKLQQDITRHGFRSTFRDWAAETTNFPNHVLEMAVAHAIPSGAESAYRRGDLFEKRRQVMEAWAAYCERPPLKRVDASNAERVPATAT